MSQGKVRLRFVGLANGEPHEAAGQYLVAYDPDYHLPDGSYDGGSLIITRKLDEAAMLTPLEAFTIWRSSPKCQCHHWRPDGKENKPLSAFTVEVA